MSGRRDENDARGGSASAERGHSETGWNPGPPTSDQVAYLCAGSRHLAIGGQRPDGSGHTTLYRGQWAYCTAGLADEPHDWREIVPRNLRDIHHSEVSAGGGIA